ncbi:MAG TPA: 2TM domain-containing protein [Longimicrobiales bacterium]
MTPLTYEQALKQAREIRSFYSHLAIYLVVNAFLVALDLLTSPDELWFFWPMLGWGIGLAVHGVSVFIGARAFGADWEERKARELMEKQR